MSNPISHRYDFVYLFDVKDGNPNGDPDAGNQPRIDPETGQGLVSDVCLKRKIRNFFCLEKAGQPCYDIYIKEKAVLNDQHGRAYEKLGLKLDEKGKKADNASKARAWMCQNFFDIRMFGAVMTTDVNCGQVRGPVQFKFARSVDPIVSLGQSLTRMAVTTKKESEDQDGGNRTMGHKEIVPYGLYRTHGYITPSLASLENGGTGFSEDDLQLLWKALGSMFDVDRSASRGEMSACKLVVFEHENPLGNAPAKSLFERVEVTRKDGSKPARDFSDYTVSVNKENLPQGITLLELI